ncbi:MAG: hypothetical protein MUD09_03835 [Desulfobacterales bacterium]|nr:hypothetical protein [Desulfobacterales bacterium]
MNKKQEKWAIFWCDLLSPIIYEQIEAEEINRYLKAKAQQDLQFPDGRVGKASLKTLRRKLNAYREGGFDALARKKRIDRGKARNLSQEVIDKAIELKKEQPHRSECIINRFLEEMYSVTVPKTTLYRHLKNAGATRLKLGIAKTKIRKRWSRDHTHDLWGGGGVILKKDPMCWIMATWCPLICRHLSTATAATLSMPATTSGKTSTCSSTHLSGPFAFMVHHSSFMWIMPRCITLTAGEPPAIAWVSSCFTDRPKTRHPEDLLNPRIDIKQVSKSFGKSI